MKIKVKDFKDKTCTLYQLDGWAKDDWMCADDFLRELMESEADYQVIPKRELMWLKEYYKNRGQKK